MSGFGFSVDFCTGFRQHEIFKLKYHTNLIAKWMRTLTGFNEFELQPEQEFVCCNKVSARKAISSMRYRFELSCPPSQKEINQRDTTSQISFLILKYDN